MSSHEVFKLYTSPYLYADNEKLRGYISEKHPDAVFVEELCLKLRNGSYTDSPGLVFYQENPPPPFTNKYFAYYCYIDTAAIIAGTERHDQWVITGLDDWNPVVDGILSPTKDGGVVTISRFRHDFVRSPECSQIIDGGRDYTKIGADQEDGLPEVVKVNLKDMTFTRGDRTFNLIRDSRSSE